MRVGRSLTKVRTRRETVTDNLFLFITQSPWMRRAGRQRGWGWVQFFLRSSTPVARDQEGQVRQHQQEVCSSHGPRTAREVPTRSACPPRVPLEGRGLRRSGPERRRLADVPGAGVSPAPAPSPLTGRPTAAAAPPQPAEAAAAAGRSCAAPREGPTGPHPVP